MRESFVFYRSFLDALDGLPDETAGHILKATIAYGINGETVLLQGIERNIFALIKPQIDANNKRYADGIKGGRPKTTGYSNNKPLVIQKENHRLQAEITSGCPEKKPNVNVNVNEADNVLGESETIPEADPGFESAQEPAAILIKTQEVKTILSASLYRMAFKPEDFAEIATRLERDDLPIAFVTWAIKQADAAKPKSPGAFIKGALLGWKNFEDWPDKYRAAVKPDEEAARSKALAQKVIDDLAAAKAEAFEGEIDLTGAFRRQVVEKAREAAGGGDEGFEDDEAAKW